MSFRSVPALVSLSEVETGRFIEVNEEYVRVSGFSHEELIGKTSLEIGWFSPDDRDRVVGAMKQNGRVTSVQLSFTTKDGRALEGLYSGEIVDVGGTPRILAVIQDVSDCKQKEAALRDSEERLRTVIEQASEGFEVLDADGRYVDANEASCRQLGYTKEELLRLAIPDVDPNVNLEKYHAGFEALRGKPATTFESMHRRKDGTLFPVEVSFSIVEFRDGPRSLSLVRDISDRRGAEAALRESEELWRTVFATEPHCVKLLDAEGRLVEMNPAGLAMLQATLPLVRGKRASDLVAEEDRAAFDKMVDDVFGGESRHLVFDMFGLEGRRLTLETTSVPLWDPNEPSCVKYLVGVTRDITARKRRAEFEAIVARVIAGFATGSTAEVDDRIHATLEEIGRFVGAEQAYVVELAPDRATYSVTHIWTEAGVDASSTVSYQNIPLEAGHWATAKLDAGEVIVVNSIDDLPPGASATRARLEQEGVRSQLSIPMRGGGSAFGGLIGFRNFSRSVTWNADDIRGIRLVSEALASAIDRRNSDEALRESERRFQHLFDGAADAVFVHDADGCVVDCNKVACDSLGYAREELLRLSVSDFEQSAAPGELGAIWDSVGRGESVTVEGTHRRRDGSTFPVEVRVAPFAAGGRTLIFAAARDITERRRAEDVHRLLEEQLRQAQKMEAIGQLAGGVAHDFNNLLSVIRNYSELLLMDLAPLSPDVEESVNEIIAASARGAELTRQLLAFGRKQVMQSHPLDLNDVVAKLTRMLNRIIGEHIRLQCTYAKPSPRVKADAGMIEQMLVNLVVNSRDAMPAGGKLFIETDEVRLEAADAVGRQGAKAGDFACLTVRDTGEGIAAEHIPHIFEPFFTTKEVGKGTGLGLATVYGIVHQHEGWVEVSSEVGAGTTFRIFIPILSRAVAESDPRDRDLRPRGGHETVLLVEDDAAQRKVTRRVLESYGYHVEEAVSGRDALRVWQDSGTRFDLLLTDVVMPEGVSGRELAERLAGMQPGLKVIFMSGYSLELAGKDSDVIERLNAEFLMKPCPPQELIRAVRQLLDRSQVGTG